jgi:hypothetical protein
MAIGTLSEYKTTRGISHTGFDSRITFALESAESAMEKFCGVADFGTATYTEEAYDGENIADVWLVNWPVTAVSAVKIRCYGTTVTQDSTSYTFTQRGRLIRDGRGPVFVYTDESPEVGYYSAGCVWPQGNQNVLVTYTAGYAPIPSDLKQIQYEMVDAVLASAGRDPAMQSESIESYSYTLQSSADKWSEWSSRMAAYRRVL